MGRRIVGWSFGVIALYLGVKYAAGAAKDANAAATGGDLLIKGFQGR